VNLDDIDERLLFDDEFINSIYSKKEAGMSEEYGEYEAINGAIANELIKERDKYKKALEEIATGKIDWTITDNLTKTRGEIFQDIAQEALNK